jgi:hypothetical protein
MGLVIEEMDASVVPEAGSVGAHTPDGAQRQNAAAAPEPLAAGLRRLMGRELRLKAD